MRPSIAFCLLSICVQLKLHVCEKICMNNQYTIIWSNGSVKNCLHCAKCHPGFGLSPVCGIRIKFPPENIGCYPCPSGTFSDTDDSAQCQSCQECVPHEIVASNCARSSDRNCTGTCTKGYYFAKKAPHNCQQCSYCCNDGNDEIQPECINQGLNATDQHCSRRLDKKCGPKPTPITTIIPAPITTSAPGTINPSTHQSHVHPTNSSAWHHDQSTSHRNSSIVIVSGVLSGLCFAALVVCALLYKRRKVTTTRDGRRPHSNIVKTETNSGETAASQSVPENEDDLLQVTVDVPQEVAHIRRFNAVQNPGYLSNSNPVTPQASPGGTPCPTDDELEDLPDVVAIQRKRSLKRQNSKDASSDSTSERLLDPKVQTSGRKGSFHNENVAEQQDIKGAESGYRRRSSGTLQTLKRKLSLQKEDPNYQPLSHEDPDEVQAPSDSTSERLLDPKVQTSGRKGSFHNENVAEQQDIKGAESGYRGRSSGTLQTLKRKLSLQKEDPNYQLLSHEDPDEVQESLRIVEHPTHQTHINEGSGVVFECKAQGKKKLSYQWLKDGTKMQGKNNCTLVFDSVKVHDFGWYSCEVRCTDGQYRSECVESSAAELDVFPPDGMRFRYLDEAFQQSPDTQQNVENLLVKEIPGSGGWKQVAFKWKMNKYAIDSLERSHEGGKGVISYLKATYPELTVYDFCKTLKESNIKRFDIIKELSGHLVSVPQE